MLGSCLYTVRGGGNRTAAEFLTGPDLRPTELALMTGIAQLMKRIGHYYANHFIILWY
jgi:hypothetical protein